MTDKTIPEVYRAAADLIDERGLAQGYNTIPGGPNDAHCTAAAVNAVAGRPLSDSSPDLLIPLADWVVAHLDEEARRLFPVLYSSDPELLARVMRGKFDECDPAEARLAVQLWNDQGSHRGRFKSSKRRTKAEVVETLRACADIVELLDQANDRVTVEELADAVPAS